MLETSESAVETLLFRARHGFAKVYERLESAMQDRCQHAHRAMAAILDGEATPVQQRAVRAHVDACRSCSDQLSRMQRGTAAYAALAPLPVPALLGERIFESLGATGANAAPAGIAKLLALAGVKAKICAVTLVATGTLTAAALASPVGEQIMPGPADEPSGNADAAAGAGVPGGSGQPVAPAAPELLPDATGTVDGLTSTTLTTVGDTVTELTRTVDAIVHKVQATVNTTVPALPADVETDIMPTPVLPTPLPTVPPLPGLP